MAYETKPNSGTLFKNDKKTTDKHPNMKGRALVGGVWYWVSAWTKEAQQTGQRYQSLSFQVMDTQPDGAPAPAPQPQRQAAPPATPSVGRERIENRPPPADPFTGPDEFTDDSIPF